MGRRSKYPEEFRQRAAQLVLDSRRSVREMEANLPDYVAIARSDEPPSPPEEFGAELAVAD